ncbi:MAG: aminotransferase class V-fold PLP-dependent enzyme, partial [Candidatus Omnitrophica bacterium]|nr:aminotransferase class V-fold PLP-dependent enzyme [Candidatus Omnitrophota bacterium]
KYYLNLKAYEKSLRESDTPWTPAISLVVGLQKVLDLIEAEGFENVLKRAAQLGEFTRQNFRRLGLELFSKAPSSTVSAAVVPAGIDGAKLVKVMRDEKGVTMAGGQGELKGKIVRCAHMGAITRGDLEIGFQVLGETLTELKNQPVTPQTANKQ